MKKRKLILLSTLLIVMGIVGFYFLKGKKVPAIRAEKRDYQEKLLVTGTVQGKEFTTLTSSIDGRIENIYIREGQRIKKDDIIVKLESGQIEAEVAQGEALYRKAQHDFETLQNQETKNAIANLKNAESSFKVAEDEFRKFEKLFQKKYASEPEYNLAKNTYTASDAQLKLAQEQLKSLGKNGSQNSSALESVNVAKNSLDALKKIRDKYYIYAPYDGFITARNVEVGQSVAPYTPMFQISSDSEKIVSINLDEKYIGRVKVGTQIEIYPYADNSRFSLGNIYYKGIDVDSTKGTLEIRGSISEDLPDFLYNSTVNVVTDGKEIKDGVLLQGIYIISQKDRLYALIEKRGKAYLQEVVGTHVIDGIVVTKGIEDGDIVLSVKDSTEGMRVSPQVKGK